MRRVLTLLAVVLFVAVPMAGAQTFSSGSTGTDGPLSPDNSQGNCTLDVGYYTCTIQVPESGILNYTTITTGAWTMRFRF